MTNTWAEGTGSLFPGDRATPLAERMRPRTLAEVRGQESVIGPESFLARAITADELPSMVLWGPPGSGKTTIARVVAAHTKAHFVAFSAVLSGVKEVRAVIEEARRRRGRERTVLFVDELHRFNKAQQDAFLPHVEDGTVVLIGATTENPSFYVNRALLSRCRVVRLDPLAPAAVEELLCAALADPERGLGDRGLVVEDDAVALLAACADGDARQALNLLEQAALLAAEHPPRALNRAVIEELTATRVGHYDRGGDEHYDLVSAFIKSMRGSDPDAAVYYLARMLANGEDPLFLARRMVIFAAEDVGNADPRALAVAVDATRAFRFLGLPEGEIVLAQACTYLASTVKSNRSYLALREAQQDVRAHGSPPVPQHIRNAPTALMKAMGNAAGYRYPHDFPDHYVSGEEYLPAPLVGRRYYRPSGQGLEERLGARLARLRQPAPTKGD
jgi:putative ATPase